MKLVFVKVSSRYLVNQELGYPLAEQLEVPPRGSLVSFPSHLREREGQDASVTRILMGGSGAAPRSMLMVNMLVEEDTGDTVLVTVLRIRNIGNSKHKALNQIIYFVWHGKCYKMLCLNCS